MVAYSSRALKEKEKQYAQIKKEIQAIVIHTIIQLSEISQLHFRQGSHSVQRSIALRDFVKQTFTVSSYEDLNFSGMTSPSNTGRKLRCTFHIPEVVSIKCGFSKTLKNF
jgi:hypothetical protein